MYFSNGSLHGGCIDGGNIGREKTDVGEMNSIVNVKKVTKLNHSGVGEIPMPFYY